MQSLTFGLIFADLILFGFISTNIFFCFGLLTLSLMLVFVLGRDVGSQGQSVTLNFLHLAQGHAALIFTTPT